MKKLIMLAFKKDTLGELFNRGKDKLDKKNYLSTRDIFIQEYENADTDKMRLEVINKYFEIKIKKPANRLKKGIKRGSKQLQSEKADQQALEVYNYWIKTGEPIKDVGLKFNIHPHTISEYITRIFNKKKSGKI